MPLTIRFSDGATLLRTTAWLALPGDLRRQVIDRSDRIARRFTGLITDGVTDGCILPVGPLTAGYVLRSSVNAAYDLRARASRVALDRAVRLYGSSRFDGLLGGEADGTKPHPPRTAFPAVPARAREA